MALVDLSLTLRRDSFGLDRLSLLPQEEEVEQHSLEGSAAQKPHGIRGKHILRQVVAENSNAPAPLWLHQTSSTE